MRCAPPSFHSIPVQRTDGEHGNGRGERAQGVEDVPRKGHVLVDLVRDDRQAVPRRDGQEPLQVVERQHAPAGVAGVVEDDGLGAGSDERLEVREVDGPVAVRVQAVRLHDAAQGLDDHLQVSVELFVGGWVGVRVRQGVACVHKQTTNGPGRGRIRAGG